MSYVKNKLSKVDKALLCVIYNKLEEINLPTTYRSSGKCQGHQKKTGTALQRGARQTCFGKTFYHQKLCDSAYSKKYPYMMEVFKKFMSSHCPTFEFDSVYVNKNVVCKRHLDSKNVGESLLVGLGEYTGGQTCLYIDDKEKKVNIKNNSLMFNGSEIEHKSMPFKGERYSLVFFKSK